LPIDELSVEEWTRVCDDILVLMIDMVVLQWAVQFSAAIRVRFSLLASLESARLNSLTDPSAKP
uniref:hypothetical protein n=1 Tax=Achromobacter sp. GbtcB20 TaxID=2824765 RepID=UPI001C2FD133